MPVAPSEVTATFSVAPSGGHTARHVKAAVDEARASGLATEAGPDTTALSGERAEVLATLNKVIDAAIEAGATTVDVKIEAATQST